MGSTIINLPSCDMNMARRRKPRLYKEVYTVTRDMGSSGLQVLIGTIEKIDAQGISGFLKNVRLSVMTQDTEASDMAYMGYLTTDNSSFNNDEIITARATAAGGGNLNLSANRYIRSNDPDAAMIAGEGGSIAVWLETANTVLAEEARVYLEVWGRYIDFRAAS